MNRIIEDAFLNIVRNEGFDFLPRPVVVVDSSANANQVPPPSRQNNNNITTTITTEDDDFPRDVLHDFSNRWFQSLESYHVCMRDYHKNISQLNRTTTDILRNIASAPLEETRNYSIRNSIFATPRNIDVQSFTLPIVQMERADATPAYPTISQIMAATCIFTYNEETRSAEHERRCPISLENFVVGEEVCEIIHCHHLFKWASIQRWFSRNYLCPVCRHDIRTVT